MTVTIMTSLGFLPLGTVTCYPRVPGPGLVDRAVQSRVQKEAKERGRSLFLRSCRVRDQQLRSGIQIHAGRSVCCCRGRLPRAQPDARDADLDLADLGLAAG